jgi:hypothetical protein
MQQVSFFASSGDMGVGRVLQAAPGSAAATHPELRHLLLEVCGCKTNAELHWFDRRYVPSAA